MGEGVPIDCAGHALLILHTMRLGLAELNERAETITVTGRQCRIGLYTNNGSCLTNERWRRLLVTPTKRAAKA